MTEEKKEVIEHEPGLIKIDGSTDPRRPLPARWEEVNKGFTIIDKAMVQAIQELKLTPYEVHLILACFQYKRETIQMDSFFNESMKEIIDQAHGMTSPDTTNPDDTNQKTPDFIK